MTPIKIGGLVILPFLTGLRSRIHAAIFSFCARVTPPMPHVRPFVVIGPKPSCGEFLRLLYAVYDVLAEPFMSDSAIVALDLGILLRLARLDIAHGNALFLIPLHQFATDVFRPITLELRTVCRATR